MVDENDDAAYIAYLEHEVYILRQRLARKEAHLVGLETDLEQAELATSRLFILSLANGNPLQSELPLTPPLEVH